MSTPRDPDQFRSNVDAAFDDALPRIRAAVAAAIAADPEPPAVEPPTRSRPGPTPVVELAPYITETKTPHRGRRVLVAAVAVAIIAGVGTAVVATRHQSAPTLATAQSPLERLVSAAADTPWSPSVGPFTLTRTVTSPDGTKVVTTAVVAGDSVTTDPSATPPVLPGTDQVLAGFTANELPALSSDAAALAAAVSSRAGSDPVALAAGLAELAAVDAVPPKVRAAAIEALAAAGTPVRTDTTVTAITGDGWEVVFDPTTGFATAFGWTASDSQRRWMTWSAGGLGNSAQIPAVSPGAGTGS